MEYKPIVIKIENDDSLENIAKQYNITVAHLKFANDNIEKVEEGDRIIIPFKALAVHIVRPLETLEKIARKYNTTVQNIKEANGDIKEIFIGQQLIIV